MESQGLAAAVAGATYLGINGNASMAINVGRNTAEQREYQMHLCDNLVNYSTDMRINTQAQASNQQDLRASLVSSSGQFGQARSGHTSLNASLRSGLPSRASTAAFRSRTMRHKAAIQEKKLTMRPEVLIRLVEAADKLNQAQAQMEYRKALKKHAKSMRRIGFTLEQEVLNDISSGVVPSEVKELMLAEDLVASENQAAIRMGRRGMARLPTRYREILEGVRRHMEGLQATERWGYFPALQQYMPQASPRAGQRGGHVAFVDVPEEDMPTGLSLAVPESPAEVLNTILNGPGAPMRASTLRRSHTNRAKRPEELAAAEPWQVLVRRRKKEARYSELTNMYFEFMEENERHFAARKIQRAWRLYKKMRYALAEEKLKLMREEMQKHKSLEDAIRAATEGVWRQSGHTESLAASQTSVPAATDTHPASKPPKKQLGFGSCTVRGLSFKEGGEGFGSHAASGATSRATSRAVSRAASRALSRATSHGLSERLSHDEPGALNRCRSSKVSFKVVGTSSVRRRRTTQQSGLSTRTSARTSMTGGMVSEHEELADKLNSVLNVSVVDVEIHRQDQDTYQGAAENGPSEGAPDSGDMCRFGGMSDSDASEYESLDGDSANDPDIQAAMQNLPPTTTNHPSTGPASSRDRYGRPIGAAPVSQGISALLGLLTKRLRSPTEFVRVPKRPTYAPGMPLYSEQRAGRVRMFTTPPEKHVLSNSGVRDPAEQRARQVLDKQRTTRYAFDVAQAFLLREEAARQQTGMQVQRLDTLARNRDTATSIAPSDTQSNRATSTGLTGPAGSDGLLGAGQNSGTAGAAGEGPSLGVMGRALDPTAGARQLDAALREAARRALPCGTLAPADMRRVSYVGQDDSDDLASSDHSNDRLSHTNTALDVSADPSTHQHSGNSNRVPTDSGHMGPSPAAWDEHATSLSTMGRYGVAQREGESSASSQGSRGAHSGTGTAAYDSVKLPRDSEAEGHSLTSPASVLQGALLSPTHGDDNSAAKDWDGHLASRQGRDLHVARQGFAHGQSQSGNTPTLTSHGSQGHGVGHGTQPGAGSLEGGVLTDGAVGSQATTQGSEDSDMFDMLYDLIRAVNAPPTSPVQSHSGMELTIRVTKAGILRGSNNAPSTEQLSASRAASLRRRLTHGQAAAGRRGHAGPVGPWVLQGDGHVASGGAGNVLGVNGASLGMHSSVGRLQGAAGLRWAGRRSQRRSRNSRRVQADRTGSEHNGATEPAGVWEPVSKVSFRVRRPGLLAGLAVPAMTLSRYQERMRQQGYPELAVTGGQRPSGPATGNPNTVSQAHAYEDALSAMQRAHRATLAVSRPPHTQQGAVMVRQVVLGGSAQTGSGTGRAGGLPPRRLAVVKSLRSRLRRAGVMSDRLLAVPGVRMFLRTRWQQWRNQQVCRQQHAQLLDMPPQATSETHDPTARMGPLSPTIRLLTPTQDTRSHMASSTGAGLSSHYLTLAERYPVLLSGQIATLGSPQTDSRSATAPGYVQPTTRTHTQTHAPMADTPGSPMRRQGLGSPMANRKQLQTTVGQQQSTMQPRLSAPSSPLAYVGVGTSLDMVSPTSGAVGCAAETYTPLHFGQGGPQRSAHSATMQTVQHLSVARCVSPDRLGQAGALCAQPSPPAAPATGRSPRTFRSSLPSGTQQGFTGAPATGLRPRTSYTPGMMSATTAASTLLQSHLVHEDTIRSGTAPVARSSPHSPFTRGARAHEPSATQQIPQVDGGSAGHSGELWQLPAYLPAMSPRRKVHKASPYLAAGRCPSPDGKARQVISTRASQPTPNAGVLASPPVGLHSVHHPVKSHQAVGSGAHMANARERP